MSAHAVMGSRRTPLVALTAAAAALRFTALGSQSFWLDEAATGHLMRMDLGGMLGALPASESTPPLYGVLEWLWTRPLGVSEAGLRSFSALVGTLTVPVVYAAGARLAGRRAGLMAAALAAFSPILVWYSQEARSYALLVLLSAVTLWALPDACRAGRRRALGLWGLAAAAALATHYFAIFVIAPQAVWLLWTRGRDAAWAIALPVVVGAALVPLALHQRARGNAHFIGDSSLGKRLLQVPKQLVVGYDAPGGTPLAVAGALLVITLAVAWVRSRPALPRGLAALAALTLGVPIVLAAAGFDYLITRNVVAAWIPAALAAAAIASRVRAGPAIVAGICAVGVAASVGTALDVHYQRDDWRAAAAAVPRGPVALVVTPASGRVPIEYYRPRVAQFPAEGGNVSALELLAVGQRSNGGGVSAPRLAAAPPGVPGFSAPTVERHATFVVVRYRARSRGGARVDRAILAALDLTRTAPALLLVG